MADQEFMNDTTTDADLDAFWEEAGAEKNEKPTDDGEEESSEELEEEGGGEGDSGETSEEESEEDGESEEEEDNEEADDESSEDADESDSGEDVEEDVDLQKKLVERGKKVLADIESDDSSFEEAEKVRKEESRNSYLKGLKIDDLDSDELSAISFPDKEFEIDGEKVNFSKFEKEYPQAVGMTKAVALHVAKQIVSDQTKALFSELGRERFFGELSAYHQDGRLISRDSKFHSWVDSQPKEIQALVNSQDVSDVAAALDLYKGNKPGVEKKSEKKKILTKKKRLLSKNVSGKKKPVKKHRFDPSDSSDEAQEYFWKEAEKDAEKN